MSSIISKLKVNKISRIHVIKAKNFSENNSKYYTSLLGDDKQYMYSFFQYEMSVKCLDFLNKYKKQHNKYPDLSYNNNIKQVNYDYDCYINEENLDDLKDRCLLNNLGLIGINTFDFSFSDRFLTSKNDFNLSISAIDLLEDEKIDEERLINNLNMIYYF